MTNFVILNNNAQNGLDRLFNNTIYFVMFLFKVNAQIEIFSQLSECFLYSNFMVLILYLNFS